MAPPIGDAEGVCNTPLRSQSLHVPRKYRRFFDVREAKDVLREALQTHAKPAFWWDAVFVHHEVVLKVRRVETLIFNALYLLIVTIDAKTTADNFRYRNQ